MPRDNNRARWIGTKALTFPRNIRQANNIQNIAPAPTTAVPGFIIKLGANVTQGQVGYAANGLAYLADNRYFDKIAEFIFTQTGSTGDFVIVTDYGVIETGSTWIDGLIYLSTAGNITQTLPTGIIQPIGHAISSIQIDVNIGFGYKT